MSPILSSQGVVLATAMAVSGTVILLALRLQKSLPNSPQTPRSCMITSEGNNKKDKKKNKNKNKRVHFAEDVVDPSGDGEAFRRQHCLISNSSSNPSSSSSKTTTNKASSETKLKKMKEMPANRVALYNGILRDRLVHRRSAYSC